MCRDGDSGYCFFIVFFFQIIKQIENQACHFSYFYLPLSLSPPCSPSLPPSSSFLPLSVSLSLTPSPIYTTSQSNLFKPLIFSFTLASFASKYTKSSSSNTEVKPNDCKRSCNFALDFMSGCICERICRVGECV